MAYISPNTTVSFLKGVPLTKDYQHSVAFASASAQNTYFASKAKHTVTGVTYQRAERESIRVGLTEAQLIDCNYMMWRNASYENKWFYAFIDEVHYSNNSCTEVIYTIDVLQTWLFDFNFGACMVEREHTLTDEKYEHVIPEDHSINTYVTQTEVNWKFNTNNLKTVVFSEYDWDGTGDSAREPVKVNATYDHIRYPYAAFVVQNPVDFVEYLNHFGKTSGIIAIISIPEEMLNGLTVTPITGQIQDGSFLRKIVKTVDIPTTLLGYTPKCNKLFNSPYTYFELTNMQGETHNLAPEIQATGASTTSSYNFDILLSFGVSPGAVCVPERYGNENEPIEHSISIGQMPQLQYSENAFATYLAQNRSQLVTNVATMATGLLLGVATGGASAVTSTIGGIMSALNTAAAIDDKRRLPDSVHGQTSTPFSISTNNFGFSFKVTTAPLEILKRCDEYMWAYGYRVNEFKVPSFNNRPYWTFLKTSNALIISKSAPASAVDSIANIFNRGITMWTSAANIGNYSLDNSPS